MRNLRLLLEYEGTAYAGWQVQDDIPTVQGELERALATLLKAPHRVTGAGRTDAGVHALGQAANFRTDSAVPLKGFLHGLNRLLPPDIIVRRVDELDLGFDSRRSAVEKTYQYFLHHAPTPSAFTRGSSWHIRGPLDSEAIGRAAADVVGTHDFEAFRSSGCDAAHAVRTIHESWVLRRGEYVEIGVRGNGFLRHMVRILVGTLVEVGRGKRSPHSLPALILSRDRRLAGPTAPPHGLFLKEVRYDAVPVESCP